MRYIKIISVAVCICKICKMQCDDIALKRLIVEYLNSSISIRYECYDNYTCMRAQCIMIIIILPCISFADIHSWSNPLASFHYFHLSYPKYHVSL